MEIDDADRRLLRLLQGDARLSHQELAAATGMSASSCWRRLKALEQAGVIGAYVALLQADRIGLDFSAIVQVSLTRHERAHVDHFTEAVARRPDVLECLSTTGEADYHLRVVCRDKEAYNAFLDDFLFRLPGIAHRGPC